MLILRSETIHLDSVKSTSNRRQSLGFDDTNNQTLILIKRLNIYITPNASSHLQEPVSKLNIDFVNLLRIAKRKRSFRKNKKRLRKLYKSKKLKRKKRTASQISCIESPKIAETTYNQNLKSSNLKAMIQAEETFLKISPQGNSTTETNSTEVSSENLNLTIEEAMNVESKNVTDSSPSFSMYELQMIKVR